ncbi:hypothetical protein MesloDRAFT_0257 [Mesorhizobium japonicum R7A]|nr:hypothetical protein MesloDRAFT_0257 [Mesorhizobium japonicum R7A]
MVYRAHKAGWVGEVVTAAADAKGAFADRTVRLRLMAANGVASHAR